MNILIMGCSWGVPNYAGLPNPPKEDYTEYLLKNMGYNVYNCALNNGSNLESLNRAKNFLSGVPIKHPARYTQYEEQLLTLPEGTSIDWIVWFHTELLRDYHRKKMPPTVDLALYYIANKTYPLFFDFAKSINAKLAIIGGAAPIHPVLYKYGKPDFLIEDWRSEILGKSLPPVHSLYRLNVVEDSKDTIEYKSLLLQKHLLILDALIESEHFPDDCHPGTEPHLKLSNTLHKVFQNQTPSTLLR